MKYLIQRTNAAAIVASVILLAGFLAARADEPPEGKVVVAAQIRPDDEPAVATAIAVSAIPASAIPARKPIIIETIEPDDKKGQTKVVTWLGLAVEESSEALSSQLGLKPGEGLTVSLVAEGSPAAKADFHKNDVLVDLDGQMLVHPLQLRKLVQMRAEGDTVNVTFYRSGKKQTIAVKLGKTSWIESADADDQGMPDNPQKFQFKFGDGLDGQLRGLNGQWRTLASQWSGIDKEKLNSEIKHTMEQTRKAIQDSVQHATSDRKSLASVDRELEDLARDGVDVDKDATVIIRSKRNSNKTMVQTDDSGSYIIEAGANTHLTARDKAGKLLFEGEIDTVAEREKVPKEVWEKVAPMYEQITAPGGAKPKTEGKAGKAGGKFKYMKQSSVSCVITKCLT